MTLLHVAAGNGYGGIERMLVAFAATPTASSTQRFVVAFAGRLVRELIDAGGTVDRLPSARASRPLTVWRARRAFAALLRSQMPDACVFHGAWPHAVLSSVARSAGAGVVFWQHQPIQRPAWPDRWARTTRPDALVFNSGFTAAHPAFSGVPARIIHPPVVSPPALTAGERAALRARLGAAPDDIVVLMAARMERWKGHEILLQAAGLVPPEARIRIWIAGGPQMGPEVRYYEMLAARASGSAAAQRVYLLGDRDDVPALMRAADVYCQPNLRGEPFGVAIAEAMCSALPCVVSAPGGGAELLDESCAIVTASGDAAAVAAALVRLAGDPKLRATLGCLAMVRAAQRIDPAGRLEELAAFVAAHAV